ncbi:flagellar basal body-associated FliL family protein [Plasticicumulans sp.]|uniref:flagellar basal body-associated FliL family protein n=1 Tax=Plasticicumulans sp. TaxID=2307179 RepID=UPI00395ED43C|nr:flagellar basal body-associated FliL family protein [Pseudomonadota bacterium]
MAKKEEAKPAEAAAAGGGGGGKGKLIIIILLVLILLILAVGATLFFTGALNKFLGHGGDDGSAVAAGGHGAPMAVPVAVPKPTGPAKYQPLDPPFVVNFDDQGVLRYVQISVSIMARDQKALDKVKENEPQIRYRLILLFSGQTFAELGTPAGKEKLQQKTLEEIQKILIAETGTPGIEAVYFTNFVMQ